MDSKPLGTSLDEGVLHLGPEGRFEIANPGQLLALYTAERVRGGPAYHAFTPATDPDWLVADDLAATIALGAASGAAAIDAFVALMDRGPLRIPLGDIPLAKASAQVVGAVAELLEEVCALPGFGLSRASKLLHAKRPALTPIMDRRAFCGAYLNGTWSRGSAPGARNGPEDAARIQEAILTVREDLLRPGNLAAWRTLGRTSEHLALFDKIWWVYVWGPIRGWVEA